MYPLTDSVFLRLEVVLGLAAPAAAARVTGFFVSGFLVVVERAGVFLAAVAPLVIGTIATNASKRSFNRWRMVVNFIRSRSECIPDSV